MPDAIGLVKLIKKAATEATEAGKPVNVLFGKVVSSTPLKINVEQKMELGEAQLILTRQVTEYETEITMEVETELVESEHNHEIMSTTELYENEFEPQWTHDHSIWVNTMPAMQKHSHKIKKKIKIIVHNGLVVGDEVILLRQQSGQKYFVVDRTG